MLRFAVVITCALTLGVSAFAASSPEADAYHKCRLTGRWCALSATDAISLEKTPFVMLASSESLYIGGVSRTVEWLLTCNGPAPVLMFQSARFMTYNAASIRYRADPGGITGEVIARHSARGEQFLIEGTSSLIEAMKENSSLIIQVRLATGDSGNARFNTAGLKDVLPKLKCFGG